MVPRQVVVTGRQNGSQMSEQKSVSRRPSTRLSSLNERAIELRRDANFQRCLTQARNDWNERHVWKIGGARLSPPMAGGHPPSPPGLADDAAEVPVTRRITHGDIAAALVEGEIENRYGPTRLGLARAAEREWAEVVGGVVERFFRDDVHMRLGGVRHPAWAWVAACLVWDETTLVPAQWIDTSGEQPTFHHPYPERLEKILNELVTTLLQRNPPSRKVLAEQVVDQIEDAREDS